MNKHAVRSCGVRVCTRANDLRSCPENSEAVLVVKPSMVRAVRRSRRLP
jgi:hypothetical protein